MKDPYVYPGTQVLINKFGLKEQSKLERTESYFFHLRSLSVPEGKFDYHHLKSIHHHLFSDVFEWAGSVRTVDIAKENSYFAHCSYIEPSLNKLFSRLQKEKHLKDLNQTEFCHKLSHYFNELNAAHPFREGNGRTQRAFLGQLAEKAGYHLNWESLNRQEYLLANKAGFLHADYVPMEKLFLQITSPLKQELSETREQSELSLSPETIEMLKNYVGKQVELLEFASKKQAHFVSDPALSQYFNDQALKTSGEISLLSRDISISPEIQKVLSENTSLLLLQNSGGFSAIHERIKKNEIRKEDILVVARQVRNQALNQSRSLTQSKGGAYR